MVLVLIFFVSFLRLIFSETFYRFVLLISKMKWTTRMYILAVIKPWMGIVTEPGVCVQSPLDYPTTAATLEQQKKVVFDLFTFQTENARRVTYCLRSQTYFKLAPAWVAASFNPSQFLMSTRLIRTTISFDAFCFFYLYSYTVYQWFFHVDKESRILITKPRFLRDMYMECRAK